MTIPLIAYNHPNWSYPIPLVNIGHSNVSLILSPQFFNLDLWYIDLWNNWISLKYICYIHIYLYLYLYLSIYLSIYIYISISIYLYLSLSLFLYIYCKNQIADVHHCELASCYFSLLNLRQFCSQNRSVWYQLKQDSFIQQELFMLIMIVKLFIK